MIDYYFSFNENIERIELIHHGKPVEYADGKTIGMPIRKYADDVSVPVKSILKTMKRDLSNSIGAECESFEINGSDVVASFKSSGFTKPATIAVPLSDELFNEHGELLDSIHVRSYDAYVKDAFNVLIQAFNISHDEIIGVNKYAFRDELHLCVSESCAERIIKLYALISHDDICM